MRRMRRKAREERANMKKSWSVQISWQLSWRTKLHRAPRDALGTMNLFLNDSSPLSYPHSIHDRDERISIKYVQQKCSVFFLHFKSALMDIKIEISVQYLFQPT